MSVVKKYQSGGSSPTLSKNSDYADFIRKKLEETKFTAKAEPLARGVASDWVGLAESGDIENAYSYDPITQEYGINPEKITAEHLKGKDWSGSKDAINTNVWGQYTSRLDRSNKRDEGEELERRKFNTLMANWTSEYLTSKKQAASQTPTSVSHGTQGIGDYTSYLDKILYGGKGDFSTQWAKDVSKIESMDERKKKIMGYAPEIIATYEDPTKRKEGWKYEDVTNKQALLDAQQRGDWEAFVTESKKLGWRPEDLLLEKTKEELAAEKTAKAGADLNAWVEDMRKKGYSEEIIQQAATGGYTTPGTFSGPQWVNEDIQKNALVLSNPTTGKTIVINKTGLYNPRYTDPDAYNDQAYGTYLEKEL